MSLAGSLALLPLAPATAADVSVCSGASLPPSAVTGLLTPVFGLLSPLLGLLLGSTLTDVASGAPINLQAVDVNGNPVAGNAICNSIASSYQLQTAAGISIGGNQITGIGNGIAASAGDIDAVAIGNGALTSVSALQAVAIGTTSKGLGIGSVAIGANAVANNAGDVALGFGSTTQAAVATTGTTLNGIAYGFAGTSPLSTVSVGVPGAERTVSNLAAGRLSATSTDAVNGSQLYATNTAVNNIVSGSLGIKYLHINSLLADSLATGTDSVAIGPLAASAGIGSIAIGSNTSASAANSVAIGSNAVASLGAQAGYTGYGLVSPQNSAGEVSIGAPGAVRKLTNLAAGSAASDAVNVGQLNQVGQNGASALGGGAAYDTATGAFTAPSYLVGGVAYNNVGGALGAQTTLLQNQGTAIAGMFGPGYAYGLTSGAFTGQLSYEGTNYNNIQAAFDAIDQAVAGKAKYFKVNSALTGAVATGVNAISAGASSNAWGDESLAVGTNAQALSASAIAVGEGAIAQGGMAVSLGKANVATGNGAVAIGDPNNATGTGSVAVGADNTANGQGAVALGNLNVANGQGAVALGNASQANAAGSVALGDTAMANATNGVALGSGAVATNAGDVALGANAVTSAVTASTGVTLAGTAYSFAGSNPAGAVSVGSAGNERQIQSVAAGVLSATSTDAVNGSQLYATNQALDAVASSLDNISNGAGIKYFRVNSSGADAAATGTDAIAIGPGAQALTASALAIGNGAIAQGGMAVSLGTGNVATGNGAVAIGDPNNATGTGAVAVGADNTANGQGAVALGNLNVANGQGAVALGNASQANAAGSVALGDTAKANAANGVALGSGSVATNAGDVALGSNSVTSTVTASTGTTLAGTSYSFAGSSPVGAVSVGSAGNERQIQNVAAGVLSATSTDAVNGSQLYATNQAVNAVASSLDNISNGGGIKYFHANSTGADSTAGGTNSVAIGPAAVTNAGASNAVAIGNASQATSAGSMALGANSVASNANDVALGTGSVSSAANGGWAGTTIFGTTIASNTLDANAVLAVSGGGINRQIQGVADGSVTASSTDAVNGSQLYYAIQAMSSFTSAPVAGDNSNNLAMPNVTAGRNGLAVGYGAVSSGQNSVSLGNGSDDGGRANVVSVGVAGATRQLVNVAAGTQATDAANISQLQPLVTALGGGANIDITTGAVTGPTYNVAGQSYNTVDAAIAATNRASVQYVTDANGNPTNHVVLTGANNGRPVTVSNVAAGVNQTDAVNVGQLQQAAQAATDPIWKSINSLAGTVAENQTEARRGIAGSTAVANLPFISIPGMWSPAMAYGNFKGEAAVAFGLQYNTQSQANVRLRATASYVPGSGDVTFGGGVGVAF